MFRKLSCESRAKFFNMPDYMRAAHQEKISTFYQLPNEPFWQAWQRFDGYQRDYPHHDYIDDELLAFFCNGVTRYYQRELDAAGFWDLCAEEDFQGAYRLIDNIAFSSYDNPMVKLETPTPPQYQNPTPQPSESVTTLEDLKELFSNGFLETAKAMQELKEEVVAMREYAESKLIELDTRIGIVEEQLDQEIEVTEWQQETFQMCKIVETLPMCTIVEDEIEKMDSELTVTGAESTEEINLQPLPECADTLELKLSNDPGVYNMNLFVRNLLERYLLDQNKSRFLIRDAGKTAGIPRTGPDIQRFYESDLSQFLSFAGEGGGRTYCDVVGSVTRPPEVLLHVPVPC